ncbi:uncharacterized protein [Triticum aestivum]|uniref:uncharacterized protein isoform X2 n=2 Tax=Triticum aestivum TaxID=4565 RepID=UPI001D01498E|nr:uncharacterized protein LOC123128409 isoform X2 [Triticum aestivum]
MTELDHDEGTMEVKSRASLKDPSVNIPVKFDFNKFQEDIFQEYALIARSMPNDIITQDPTPKSLHAVFYELSPQLWPILEKDSVRCLLNFLVSKRGMTWKHTITSQTLTYMISYDALRCAKVILEGKAPRLNGHHANPNCINPYGYFPLHEAAERFSVDMIKLLFRHGASASVRTVGDNIIENLLPLHVAVENTCLHKYLEDNLFPYQNHWDYIYKIIHLLCMPEMKIFLDTVRLLAERTDNLVDEIWNYVKDGKLVQSAVLLLSAQAQIRGGCSSKRNGNNKRDGFDIIMCHIVRHLVTLRSENKNTNTRKLREEERIFMEFTGLLVDIVSQAGEALSAYIQAHSKAPHMEVLERVSSILKEYGFCPTGEIVDVKNLCPYNCVMSDEELYHQGLMNSTKGGAAEEVHAAEKYLPKGWDNTFTRRKFFPYWRSVLQARAFLRVYPAYATADASRPTVPTPVPGHKLPSLGKAPQLLSNRQSRRLFGTDASAARSALGYEELRCPRGSSMDRTPSQNHNLSLLEELHKQQIIMVNLEDSLVLLRPSS